jgi:hypothetical protein
MMADFAKCGKYFDKLEARFPFGPYSQQAQINAGPTAIGKLKSKPRHWLRLMALSNYTKAVQP